MSNSSLERRGFYFEEFEVGQMVSTPGRTITETDVVNFAGVSGDYNRIHTDAHYAKGHMFGQRVAHGLVVLSIATGLSVRTGFMEDTVLAFREISEWKFSRPVFLGDTIRVTMEIVDTKPIARLNGGSITLKVNVLNQDETVVQRGRWVMLVSSKPAA
jgi:acyl dehydratase